MEITIRVSDLLQRAKELSSAGYEFVDVTILEPDEELPACLHFSAHGECDMMIDFECIDDINSDE
jgi:hypothetical protein